MTRIYRTAEDRAAFDPGRCPNCGGPGIVEWIEVSTSGDVHRYPAIPGVIRCANECWKGTPPAVG